MRAAAVVLLATVLALPGCRRREQTQERPAEPSGRSWPTPPLEQGDGGTLARRLPRIAYRGGPILRNPRIVTVTWKSDDPALVARLERFGEAVTRTAWWRTVVDSYCVKPDDCIGEGRRGVPAHLDGALPAEASDGDIEAILLREIEAGRISAPADALLVVYLPKGVGFHDAVVRYCAGGARALHGRLRAAKTQPAFAVVPRCSDEAELTAAASHEILEATTNPDPAARGFAFDQGTASLGFTAAGVEPVDPCGLITRDRHRTTEGGFTLQRAWSNRAASLGRDPCVPSRPEAPYFVLVPKEPAVRLAKEGDQATLVVEAASDRPLPSWTASVVDLTGERDGEHYVDVAIDRTTITAGEAAKVTITLRRLHPRKMSIVGIVSTSGSDSHVWPVPVVMR